MSGQPVSIHILDREYVVACEPDERPALLAAAAHLDAKMREIRQAARTATLDRVAVLAALNVTHELLQLKREGEHAGGAIGEAVKSLRARIDAALEGLPRS